jgi:general secretion pathway protein K
MTMQSTSLNNPCQSFKQQQKGTALITVVLIAAVVIVMVMESIKVVRFQKQLSSNLINRDQATSYLLGMEELAKIWLKKSFKNNAENYVHLNQAWAQEAITFPIDGGGMTASVKDMQSCFNLNSITLVGSQSGNSGTPGGGRDGGGRDDSVEERERNDPDRDGERGNGITPPGNGRIDGSNDSPNARDGRGGPQADNEVALGEEIFEELINQINSNSAITGKALTATTRDWIDQDTEPYQADGAEDNYYQGLDVPYRTANSLLAHSSELLTIKGYERKLYSELLPYVCVLPSQNIAEINVNTVKEEQAALLFAALGAKDLSLSDVTQAIQNRPEKGYETVAEFIEAIGSSARVDDKYKDRLTVSSNYFEVLAKAEIGNTRVTMKTLFHKDNDNSFKVVSRYFGKE